MKNLIENIQLIEIFKSYSANLILENISLNLNGNFIHGLVGENGAGKSTLVKILTGLIAPTNGYIKINNQNVALKNVSISKRFGISHVSQELSLFPDLNVYQNIFIKNEIIKYFFLVDWDAVKDKTNSIFQDLDIHIDIEKKAKDLKISDQQIIEIIKAIYPQPKYLILDEPTSSIGKKEQAILHKILFDLKKDNIGTLFISHKLDEIILLCDIVTVLKDGKIVDTVPTENLKKDNLIAMMTGKKQLFTSINLTNQNSEDVVIKVQGLSKSNHFQNINFSLKRNQIHGFFGLIGSQRSDVMRSIIGLESFDSGQIFFGEKNITGISTVDAMNLGIGFLSEDRKTEGIFTGLSIKENISSTILKFISRFYFINKASEDHQCIKFIKSLAIKTSDGSKKIELLSGGNQQKVILSKLLAFKPQILILDEPTRGIDVGAKQEIFKIINQMRNDGLSIIYISSEIDELMNIADHITVFSKGMVSGSLSRNEFEENRLLEYSFSNFVE